MRALATMALALATLTPEAAADTRLPPDEAAVAARIDKIVASIHNPGFDDELWENTLLREMYQHSGLFLPGIQGYLRANPTAPELNVHVALLALQCLPIDQYLEFTARLANAENGAVGKWALFYSVVPGVEWSARLGLAYKEPKVRVVLNEVAASPNADKQVRSAVAGLLRGDVARFARKDKGHDLLKCPTK